MSFSGNASDRLKLVVRELDEKILCHIVPGEKKDTWDALGKLKDVLSSVIDARDQVCQVAPVLVV
jgi:hypothetical protein